MVSPPVTIQELASRADRLRGASLEQIAQGLGVALPDVGLHTKGKVGTLIERALGASGGASAVVDFPALGVELKTLPLRTSGTPSESTFVAAITLRDAETATWESSWVRRKLAHVLWVPVLSDERTSARWVGTPFFWRPTDEQEAVLREDFEEIMGLIGMGDIERVNARLGRYLQLRPKAASGNVRTLAYDGEGVRITTVPRGFYLRARFTGALVRDPAALP